MKLATDIGGTFTDLVYFDPRNGRLGFAKTSSTPPDFADGIIHAIEKSGLDAEDVTSFVHGTTVVINALTERRGARTALVTTAGFRDSLSIGRANRPDMYNLRFKKQVPFVPRELAFEVSERLNFRGEVKEPLDEDEVREVAMQLKSMGVDAVAVSFLHSYRNPQHEQKCSEILAEVLTNVAITASHEIIQEWREYERTNTAVLNAYVQPVSRSYLGNLESKLGKMGIAGPLHVMKSNGGTATFELSKQQPIHMVESGPVAGVIGANQVARAVGIKNIITLDIGGTTAKTSLVEDGRVKITTDYKIERDATRAGYPIKVPVVDIVEIGAGGGSIASVDDGGSVRIGPESAGSRPGPACYGLGGTSPTVTDANLVAGRLNPEYFLGGDLSVDIEPAREAIRPIAETFGISIEEAALGIIRVANANMVNAIKLVSVRRGYDPRDFTMVAFGGGGAMHAAALAAELRIKRVLIPTAPGTFSALGMLTTKPTQDFVRTRLLPSDEQTFFEAEKIFDELSAEAVRFLSAGGYEVSDMRVMRWADMRYRGQEHTVRVPVPQLDRIELEQRFHQLHEQTYTFKLDSKIEFVNFHVTAVVEVHAVDPANFTAPDDGDGRPNGRRRVLFEGIGWLEVPIFERQNLPVGTRVEGPAIIEEPTTTTVVFSGQEARIDPFGNLLVQTEVGA